MSRFFTRKPPYTPVQIKEQMSIVQQLVRERDNMQNEEERTRATTAVECGQEILNYMIEEVAAYGRK